MRNRQANSFIFEFYEFKMISTGWTIALVVIGVILIIGILLAILIKKNKIRLHGGYFHIINLDDESVKALSTLLKRFYSPKVIMKRIRTVMENKLIEHMHKEGLFYDTYAQISDDAIDMLINGYWRNDNKSSEDIKENLKRYDDFINNDLGRIFAEHAKDENSKAVYNELNKHLKQGDIPTDEYMYVYLNLFDRHQENFMDSLYDLLNDEDLPYLKQSSLFYEIYEDTSTGNYAGGGLTPEGMIFMTMYYKAHPDDFVRDQYRANEKQKELMNELFDIIIELLKDRDQLTVENIQTYLYNNEYDFDVFEHYGFNEDVLVYICDECKKSIDAEMKATRVVNKIDLSTFEPPAYNPKTWESDNPYTDDPSKATLIYSEPFSGVKGFQIKNGTKELATVNTITVRGITDPIAKDSLEQINKDIAKRLRGIRVSKFSVHVTYDGDREMNPNHTFYAYKGSLGEYVNEMKRDTFVPFTLLTAGFELTNLTRGFASTVGMYFSSDISIANSYANGGVIYKYNIEYNKYYYSFIRHNISDHVLEFITHNFDNKYIAFPSDRAIKLWCCLQPDYLEEVMNQKYHMSLEQIKQSLIDEYAKEYDDKEIEAAFTAERVSLEHAACKTPENARAREKYYNDRNIDLVISYKHGGDTHDNDRKRNQINHDLIKNVPCYEVILRKGGKTLITDILMMVR